MYNRWLGREMWHADNLIESVIVRRVVRELFYIYIDLYAHINGLTDIWDCANVDIYIYHTF